MLGNFLEPRRSYLYSIPSRRHRDGVCSCVATPRYRQRDLPFARYFLYFFYCLHILIPYFLTLLPLLFKVKSLSTLTSTAPLRPAEAGQQADVGGTLPCFYNGQLIIANKRLSNLPIIADRQR